MPAAQSDRDDKARRIDGLLAVVAAILSLAIFTLLTFVVPVLEKAWLGGDPPKFTALVIAASNIVRRNGLLMLPLTSLPMILAFIGRTLANKGNVSLGRGLIKLGVILGAFVLLFIINGLVIGRR